MQCPVLVKILVNEEVKDHTEDKEDVKIRFFLMRLRHKLIPGKIHMWHGVPCALWIINNWSIYIFFIKGKKKYDRCLCNIHIHVPVSKTISLYFFT